MKIILSDFELYAGKNKTFLLFETPHTEFCSGHLNLIDGASGCGKTTLLNAICRRCCSFSGRILFDGKKIQDIRKPFKNLISYVTVDNCCIPELKVRDHLNLVSKDFSIQDKIMEELGLSALKDEKVSRLSKGEQIRLAIARAILKGNPVLLFDEPTANLDDDNKRSIFKVLSSLSKNHLVIVATHDSRFLDDSEVSCSSFLIQNKRLARMSSPKTEPEVPCNVNDGKNRKTKSLFLSGISFSFRHGIQFFFSTLFFTLILFSSFLSYTASNVNKENLIQSAIQSSPYSYSRVNKRKWEPNDGNLVQCTYARAKSSPENYSINVACLEDFDKERQDKCSDLFNSFSRPEEYAGEENYHPIILTQDQIDVFRKDSNNKIIYQVGDEIPISLADNGYALQHVRKKDHFILAGILQEGTDIDKNGKNSFSALFPCIIKRKDYISCLGNSGIRTSEINDSLYSIAEKYQEYCLEKEITIPKICPRDGSYALRTIIPCSKVSSLFKLACNDEEENHIYYKGFLPEAEDEIRIPDDEAELQEISLLFQNDTLIETRSDISFFQPYRKEGKACFPLLNHYGYLGTSSNTSFSITGSFHLNTSADWTRKDCVIVSDKLFNQLLSQAEKGYKDGWKDDVESAVYYLSNRTYLRNNVDKIESGDLKVYTDTRSSCFDAYTNIKKTATVLSYLAIVIAIISFVFSLLYILNTKTELSHCFAVLELLGCSKTDQLFVLLSALIPFRILPIIFSFALSQPLTQIIRNALARSNCFLGAMMLPSLGYSYLLRIGVYFLFLVLAISFSYLGKKKKSVQQIKEDS